MSRICLMGQQPFGFDPFHFVLDRLSVRAAGIAQLLFRFCAAVFVVFRKNFDRIGRKERFGACSCRLLLRMGGDFLCQHARQEEPDALAPALLAEESGKILECYCIVSEYVCLAFTPFFYSPYHPSCKVPDISHIETAVDSHGHFPFQNP